MIHIALQDGTREFAPGQKVSGELCWSELASGGSDLYLDLVYYTEGKGQQDREVVQELTFRASGSAGALPFSLKLPDAPYSFEGVLITLKWALEAHLVGSKAESREEIILSPWTQVLKLHKVVEAD